MLITVTRAHIAIGHPRNCTHCPIANAMRDATGDEWYVTADSMGCYVSGAQMPLPDAARAFVALFDNGLSVEPFEFEVSIPVPC